MFFLFQLLKIKVAYNFDEFIEYRCKDDDMIAEPKTIESYKKETFGIWWVILKKLDDWILEAKIY